MEELKLKPEVGVSLSQGAGEGRQGLEVKVLTKNVLEGKRSRKMRDLAIHVSKVECYLEGDGQPWKILFKTLTGCRY